MSLIICFNFYNDLFVVLSFLNRIKLLRSYKNDLRKYRKLVTIKRVEFGDCKEGLGFEGSGLVTDRKEVGVHNKGCATVYVQTIRYFINNTYKS